MASWSRAKLASAEISNSRQIQAARRRAGRKRPPYGRVAKFLNIYIKTMLIIGTDTSTPFANSAHPPIDRILLKKLAEKGVPLPNRKSHRLPAWTKLNQKQYFRIINAIRKFLGPRKTLWKIEYLWKSPASEKDP